MRNLLFLLLLVGCSPGFDLTIGIALDDKCLTYFPACTAEGYRCEDEKGNPIFGCRVGCVAARELQCTVDGPMCRQTAGTPGMDIVNVPVVCVSAEAP